jgi:hypothetical protein
VTSLPSHVPRLQMLRIASESMLIRTVGHASSSGNVAHYRLRWPGCQFILSSNQGQRNPIEENGLFCKSPHLAANFQKITDFSPLVPARKLASSCRRRSAKFTVSSTGLARTAAASRHAGALFWGERASRASRNWDMCQFERAHGL